MPSYPRDNLKVIEDLLELIEDLDPGWTSLSTPDVVVEACGLVSGIPPKEEKLTDILRIIRGLSLFYSVGVVRVVFADDYIMEAGHDPDVLTEEQKDSLRRLDWWYARERGCWRFAL